MEDILSKLQNNTLAMPVYVDSNGKLLVCKTPFSNNKLSLPSLNIQLPNKIQVGKATTKDISVQIIENMRKEFGLDGQLLYYYETTRIPYIFQDDIYLGNCVGYYFEDAGTYKGKPEIKAMPTGIYTDISYKTLEEIEVLFKNNDFDINSYYFIKRYQEDLNGNLENH